MTDEERVERLAEHLCLEAEGKTHEYWYNLIDRQEWFEKAESELAFLPTLGCVWPENSTRKETLKQVMEMFDVQGHAVYATEICVGKPGAGFESSERWLAIPLGVLEQLRDEVEKT